MVAAITERRKNEERRAHLLAECPQAPIIKVQSELLFDLKESNQRVAVALETLAARGAQVDSHEKHLDTHDAHIDTAFNQIRGIDARVMNLEIKKGEWEGSKKAKEEIGAKVEKRQNIHMDSFGEDSAFYTYHPWDILSFLALFWLSDKYHFFLWIAQQFKDMTK